MIKTLTRLLLLLPLASFGQEKQAGATANSVINTVTAKLDNYSANHSIEKAHLHFDKPYYTAGDTIYFKGYITLGAQHKLSALSGILYADLIGPDNKINRSLRLPVTSGTATGDFALPDSLKGGNYRVRAYTQWMRNEGESSFFEQTFAVGSMENKQVPESAAPKSKGTGMVRKPGIRFLPEGGNLIAGNYSKIAFKAIGTDGLGIDVKGTVVDDTQAEISSFTSTHLGMGAFVLVPQPGRTYKANITYADGSTDMVELPKAITSGYTIVLNNTTVDSIRIRITAGNGMANEKLSLVARRRGLLRGRKANRQPDVYCSNPEK